MASVVVRAAWLGAVLALALAGGAAADAAYEACIDRSGANRDWSRCGGELIAREEARLNAIWRRVYGAQAGRTKADLLAEQRAWIRYKDASCRHWANGEFGREGQVLYFPMCRAQVIDARVKALETFGQP